MPCFLNPCCKEKGRVAVSIYGIGQRAVSSQHLGGIVGRSGGFLRAIVGRIRSLSVTTWLIVGAIFGGILGSSIIVRVIFGGTDGGVSIVGVTPKPVTDGGVSIVGVTPSPVYDYKRLIDDLRSAGATVEEHSSPTGEQSYFKRGSTLSLVALLGSGRRVSVNGETIRVYEYPDVLAADTEAGFVSPDGYNISVPLGDSRYLGSHYEWVEPPHFFKKGRVIVLYVGLDFRGFLFGDDPPLVEVLQRALGPQFAGSSFITR